MDIMDMMDGPGMYRIEIIDNNKDLIFMMCIVLYTIVMLGLLAFLNLTPRHGE